MRPELLSSTRPAPVDQSRLDMPERLEPSSAAAAGPDALSSDPQLRSSSSSSSSSSANALRLLTRSPHPYHRHEFEIFRSPDARPASSRAEDTTAFPPFVDGSVAGPEKDSVAGSGEAVDGPGEQSPSPYPSFTRGATPTSESGTEADDEHFLKGLPAPRRLHKGLRGRNEVISGTSTPMVSPAAPGTEGYRFPSVAKRESPLVQRSLKPAELSRRRKEVARRLGELLILGLLGFAVQGNHLIAPILRKWKRELLVTLATWAILSLIYPLRLILWAHTHRRPSTSLPLTVPASFDPAPLLYPPAVTLLVAAIISVDNEAVILPNAVLAICSLPLALVPTPTTHQGCNTLHWALSCLPLFFSTSNATFDGLVAGSHANSTPRTWITHETSALLYPLHHNLCILLQSLTTTSLLSAELQLFSVALINLVLLSSSPQAVILQKGLWVGGLDLLVSCSHVVAWGIALARVPKWRFKRVLTPTTHKHNLLAGILSWKRVKHDLFHVPGDGSSCSSCEAADDHVDSDDPSRHQKKAKAPRGHLRVNTISMDRSTPPTSGTAPFPTAGHPQPVASNSSDANIGTPPTRRHTVSAGDLARKSSTHTPSGRRKRAASSSARAWFSLTQEQAAVRKWMYAAYVYTCIIATLFAPVPIIGVLRSVTDYALHGKGAIGWSLGYLLGGLPWFRWQVVSQNLEWWVCLPSRPTGHGSQDLGWIDSLRRHHFGEANTRLLMSAYCVIVITVGLIVVFRLSPIYEVDTRRKVFHFMMVAMFLPLTFVDPAFVALALVIILALFLLLDLLRASQLPPLSKPLASFLAPYVDGRDLRGPVVVSHIFLLIGCAIPLWLSLGSLPRTGSGHFAGWEVPAREVSMVAGVVCVGLGDAAASLIGRRYGHRKWLWGGGKSLEGSVAFAAAVFVGLMAVHAWLVIGGWPSATVAAGLQADSLLTTMQKSGFCAGVASFTEAVLTGGNDNVIVPVVLWTCVKGLGV